MLHSDHEEAMAWSSSSSNNNNNNQNGRSGRAPQHLPLASYGAAEEEGDGAAQSTIAHGAAVETREKRYWACR